MLESTGERQVKASLGAIAHDHISRYSFAACDASLGSVIDVGAGVCYGSYLLATYGFGVDAVEISKEAIEYADRYYSHDNVTYLNQDINDLSKSKKYDFGICFEIIEHIENPEKMISILKEITDYAYFSVPNESVIPFSKFTHPFHVKHYTPEEFTDLITNNYGKVSETFTQYSKADGTMKKGDDGRTLIIKAYSK